MSIVRLSVLKNTAYAPDSDGDIKLAPYNRRRRVGRMEAYAPPELAARNSAFRHYLDGEIARAASDLAPDQPVVVMVHGFLFDPKAAISPTPEETDNPHGRVYHFVSGQEPEEQRHHTSSWPLGLGFEPDDATGSGGLALAFGWQSQPGFASSLINHFQNFYARAYENAGSTAWILVNAIHALNELLPGHPIDLFCHSLGSRVVTRALAMVAKQAADDSTDNDSKILPLPSAKTILDSIGRIVILGGAEYVVEAQLMRRRLERMPLQQMPQVYNFVSRENDVLDKLGENFGPRTFGNSQVIGHNGLDVEGRFEGWMDLQIDHAALQSWMSARDHEISGDRPGNVWDHWYYYTYRGNMRLYNDILRNRAAWAIPALRDQDIPEGVSKRWWQFGD